MARESINISLPVQFSKDNGEGDSKIRKYMTDGSTTYKGRIDDTQKAIDFYRAQKKGDIFDAFYEEHLSVFEDGLSVAQQILEERARRDAKIQEWIERDPNANPTVLGWIYDHPVNIPETGTPKKGWEEEVAMGYAFMLHAVFGYGSVALTDTDEYVWIGRGSGYNQNGPVTYEGAVDIQANIVRQKQTHTKIYQQEDKYDVEI